MRAMKTQENDAVAVADDDDTAVLSMMPFFLIYDATVSVTRLIK